MTNLDLKQILDTSSAHTLFLEIEEKIKNSAIVNIYTINGNCFKVKGNKGANVIKVTPDYITVAFDSHISDIMYTAIEHIEYFGGIYDRNNITKNKKQ